MKGKRRYLAVSGSAVVAALIMTACSDMPDTAGEPGGSPAPVWSVDPSIPAAYAIGEDVTVQGTVTRVLSPASFELNSPGYGDPSLLVIFAGDRDVEAGDRVEIPGNVQKFGYRSYADEYRLDPDASAYADFEGELFVVSAKAEDLP